MRNTRITVFSVLVSLAFAIGGCASSTVTYDAKGQRQITIDCTDQGSWNICFQEASSICPKGYLLIDRRGEGVTDPASLVKLGQSHFREMTIRCK